MAPSQTTLISAAFAVGAALSGLVTFALTKKRGEDRKGRMNAKARAFSLLSDATDRSFFLAVNITFTSQADLDYFKSEFVLLADFIERSELGTLSYALLQSDKEPLMVQVFEQYVSKDYYMSVHKNSPQFLAFRPKLQALVEKSGAVIAGQSYESTAAGGFI